MVSSELRANARQSLKGKWGKAALLTLCYSFLMLVIGFVLNLIPIIGTIAYLVISTPISYGVMVCFMKLKRDEEFTYTDFFQFGFEKFGKVWGVVGNTILKMIVPVILVIVCAFVMAFSLTGTLMSGFFTSSYHTFASFGGLAILAFVAYIASIIYVIVKGFLYSLSFFILHDNPEKTGKEIVEESESLMRGNRWNYFWLSLTFIGWIILSIFTLYIGFLWLIPYILISFIAFYEALANPIKKPSPEPTNDNPISEEK